MIVDRKNDNKLERKRKAYVLETMNFFNKSNYKYLSRYWDSTLFVINKKEDCQKIKEFIKKEVDYPDIDCSTTDKNVTNITGNIIKIMKDDHKYKINLISRNCEPKMTSLFPEIDDFYDKLLEFINSTLNENFTTMKDLKEHLDYSDKKQNVSNLDSFIEAINKHNDIQNESLGIKDKDDLINIARLIIKTEDNGLIKFFSQKELEQDIITDAFYVNNVTINNSIYHNYFCSSETKFRLFFDLQSILSKL